LSCGLSYFETPNIYPKTEIILNDIVAIGIEEGPVLFQMTAKVIVQALHKGKACNGKACKDKSFKANACKGMACKGMACKGNAS
jgi:hypothetical protein